MPDQKPPRLAAGEPQTLHALLEETARHAGHADILAELVDGRAGR